MDEITINFSNGDEMVFMAEDIGQAIEVLAETVDDIEEAIADIVSMEFADGVYPYETHTGEYAREIWAEITRANRMGDAMAEYNRRGN